MLKIMRGALFFIAIIAASSYGFDREFILQKVRDNKGALATSLFATGFTFGQLHKSNFKPIPLMSYSALSAFSTFLAYQQAKNFMLFTRIKRKDDQD